MSSHSRRTRAPDKPAGSQSASRSLEEPQMSNSRAIEGAQSSGGGGGLEAFFSNLFSGGNQQARGASNGAAAGQQNRQAQSVSRVQTGLGADIDQGIMMSPSLANRVNEILRDGWTIRWSQEGENGSFMRRAQKTIVINQANRGNVHGVVGTLAHETGHAITPLEQNNRRDANYANNMVRSHLRNEAEAIVFNIQCAEETDTGFWDREDMGVRAPNGSRQLYEQYTNGQISRRAMIDGIARLMGESRPSTDPSQNYIQWYSQYYPGANGNINWGG